MALNDLELSAGNIEQLYNNVLIEVSGKTPSSSTIIADKTNLNYLGNNLKGVIILVNQPDATYLPDEALDFLSSILNACKYALGDVAIINCANRQTELYESIKTTLDFSKIILFNVNMSSVGLPLNAPNYQVQAYDNIKLLAAPDLITIKNDKVEKNALWTSLQKLFEI